ASIWITCAGNRRALTLTTLNRSAAARTSRVGSVLVCLVVSMEIRPSASTATRSTKRTPTGSPAAAVVRAAPVTARLPGGAGFVARRCSMVRKDYRPGHLRVVRKDAPDYNDDIHGEAFQRWTTQDWFFKLVALGLSVSLIGAGFLVAWALTHLVRR